MRAHQALHHTLNAPTPARRTLNALTHAEHLANRNPRLAQHALQRNWNALTLLHAATRIAAHRQPATQRLEHDDLERVDAAWEDQEAQERRQAHETLARDLAAERRERRQRTSTLQLHRQALARMTRMSTVPAGNVAASRGGDPPAGPPAQQLLDADPRLREHWQVIRSRLELTHDLLDGYELGAGGDVVLSGVEKDRLILVRGAGLSAAGVVGLLGTGVAGSVRTVERVRLAAGVSVRDGLPREDAA